MPMVDMSLDRKEKEEIAMPSPQTYPYGLCISLCEDELEKLDIDHEDLGVGDMVHLHCLAKVTSVSSHDNEYSNGCRVELQICYMNAESEDEENEEEDKKNRVTSKLYKK